MRTSSRIDAMWRMLLCLVVALASLGCESGSASSGDARGGDKKLKIAVIPKGTTHEFWKSVHAGAVKASRELGVEIVWKGPLKEDDLKQQIEVVQQFTAQRVDGIVLAPLNDKALVKSVEDAKRAKIPTVIFDSALSGESHVSYVATDNVAAGKLAGEHMQKALGGKGAIVVLRYQEGSASTAQREQGFLEAVKAAGLEVKSDNQYAGATTETANAAAESLLLAQKAPDGAIAGVFAPNESSTMGMLIALRKLGLGGKIKFIGFDASDKLIEALNEGHIEALVVQDPMTMGYLGVKTMVSHIKGEKIEKVIDTGSKLVTKDNMKEPAIAQLLKPDLEEWLGE
jgi:ribose transport system substrate-binding protein